MRQVPDLPLKWARIAAVATLVVTVIAIPGLAGQQQAKPPAPQTATAQVPQSDEVPSMDNDSFYTPPPPLAAGWPVGARDAQFRGAACEEGYSTDAAKRKGETGDDAYPTMDRVAEGLPTPYLAVRRLPFLTRRDVLKALFATAENGTFEVRLLLNEEGAKKVQEYTAEHKDQCIALVAAGKIVWHPTISEPVTDGTFVLSGQFTVTEAQAITNLFNN
jgi:preprotein translocase subunit SecD